LKGAAATSASQFPHVIPRIFDHEEYDGHRTLTTAIVLVVVVLEVEPVKDVAVEVVMVESVVLVNVV